MSKYRPPKPSQTDWDKINEYWGVLLAVEDWIKTNYLTATYTQMNGAKMKQEKYKKLISEWNSKFRKKTNRLGRIPLVCDWV